MPYRFNLLAWLTLLALSAAAYAQDSEPLIPLDQHLRLLIRPTLLGLVPPADPEGFGEVFVRVLELDHYGLSAYYEVKEELTGVEVSYPPDPNAATRIRRGTVDVSGLPSAAAILPPLFWGDGDWQTATGLLWLSRTACRELDRSGSTGWQAQLPPEAVGEAAAVLREQIERLMAGQGLEPGAAVQLRRISSESYPCLVNGERRNLPALLLRDSLGLAQYWVLDDPNHPLILKMNLLPPETTEPQPEQEIGLLDAGSGYAVVEINF